MNLNASSSLQQASRTDSISRVPARTLLRPQPAGGDQVRLSSLSSSMRNGDSGSVERGDYVAQVGRVISSGSYHVDSDTLSATLMHTMAAAA